MMAIIRQKFLTLCSVLVFFLLPLLLIILLLYCSLKIDEQKLRYNFFFTKSYVFSNHNNFDRKLIYHIINHKESMDSIYQKFTSYNKVILHLDTSSRDINRWKRRFQFLNNLTMMIPDFIPHPITIIYWCIVGEMGFIWRFP